MKDRILFIFFMIPLYFFAQENDTIYENTYIEIMDDKLSVKLDIDNDIETLTAVENGIEFDIEPNQDYITEVSVHYRFISFKLGFSPHLFTNYDTTNKGESKSFKLESDFYIKKWIQTLGYSQTKGFYSSNYPIPESYPTDYLILDQLKIWKIHGATHYRFNPNYSLRAITAQTEIQRQSAGTFIPGLEYNYNSIDNKATQQKLTTFNVTFSAGYLHSFVVNKVFYASIGASPGLGIDFNKIKVTTKNGTISDKDTNYTLNIDAHIGLGYNTVNWFGGAYFRMIAIDRKDNIIVNYDNLRTHFQVFIGYRFKAPKFLRKQVDWIEEKSPIN